MRSLTVAKYRLLIFNLNGQQTFKLKYPKSVYAILRSGLTSDLAASSKSSIVEGLEANIRAVCPCCDDDDIKR